MSGEPTCHRRVKVTPEWFPRPDGLERAVTFQPGYNCSATGPRSHGVHGMEIAWRLRGPKGEAWFRIGTTWTPGELYPGHGRMPDGYPPREAGQYPDGRGIGYHAPVPQYEGQDDGGPCPDFGDHCYGDASYGGSDLVARALTEDGEPAVWAALEARYADLIAPEGQS